MAISEPKRLIVRPFENPYVKSWIGLISLVAICFSSSGCCAQTSHFRLPTTELPSVTHPLIHHGINQYRLGNFDSAGALLALAAEQPDLNDSQLEIVGRLRTLISNEFVSRWPSYRTVLSSKPMDGWRPAKKTSLAGQRNQTQRVSHIQRRGPRERWNSSPNNDDEKRSQISVQSGIDDSVTEVGLQ